MSTIISEGGGDSFYHSITLEIIKMPKETQDISFKTLVQ